MRDRAAAPAVIRRGGTGAARAAHVFDARATRAVVRPAAARARGRRATIGIRGGTAGAGADTIGAAAGRTVGVQIGIGAAQAAHPVESARTVGINAGAAEAALAIGGAPTVRIGIIAADEVIDRSKVLGDAACAGVAAAMAGTE